MQWSFSLKHERISKKPQYHSHSVVFNVIVYYTDLEVMVMIFKVIVIEIYYTNFGGISNSNSNILIFKAIVHYIAL